MIAIFDYGSGNIRSAQKAFAATGRKVEIVSDPKVAMDASALVVPGVGAFAACMEQIANSGGIDLIETFYKSGKQIFGICVGMQVLFNTSSEKGSHKGIGILNGDVTKLQAQILPQIGWNTVSTTEESKLFAGIKDESFYFVHSFAVKSGVMKAINTYADYEEKFLASVEYENVCATQFHPEKSGKAGLRLIKNWVARL